MPELLTFKAAKAARELAKVSGVCASSEDFKSLLNQATRKLMARGPGDRAWWGTVQKLKICTYANCIVWPRWVSTPLAVNIGKKSIPVSNAWFDFMPFSRGDWNCGGFGWNAGTCSGNTHFVNDGASPVFRNIPCGKNFYVRFYIQSRQDAGKKIVLFGTDYNGQEIRTLRGDGTYQDGVEITLGLPFASTPFAVRNISRIVKPVTANVVRAFQYDADNNILLECATYYPNETSPSYRTSQIHGRSQAGNCSGNSCNGLTSVEAMVKLEFIAVENDDDLVLIESLDALALMMQSIRSIEGDSISVAERYEAAAIREMNLRLEDKFPIGQIPIEVQAFGTALPGRAGIGRII